MRTWSGQGKNHTERLTAQARNCDLQSAATYNVRNIDGVLFFNRKRTFIVDAKDAILDLVPSHQGDVNHVGGGYGGKWYVTLEKRRCLQNAKE